ncbi:hypothetical protein DIPPA_20016 [Diplonema papillatum]|nr:hypothetical protein DIPPA_20016 [Diplonema papillatum]
MRNALAVAAEHGHDALVFPSFGYPYLEHLSAAKLNTWWMKEAAAFTKAPFKKLVLVEAYTRT